MARAGVPAAGYGPVRPLSCDPVGSARWTHVAPSRPVRGRVGRGARVDGRSGCRRANAGTENTVDIDDIAATVALQDRYDFWLHVDGAFGAYAGLSPEFAPSRAGVDGVDCAVTADRAWSSRYSGWDTSPPLMRTRAHDRIGQKRYASLRGMPNGARGRQHGTSVQ